MAMKLYTYWRSTAAYRVRIALNLKGLEAEQIPVHLVRDGGEHNRPEYLAINPAGKIPTLIDGDVTLTQSLAILEYLDETHPEPPLVPGDAAMRAQIRAFAQTIISDTHPIQNVRVLGYLRDEFGADKDQVSAWARHWIGRSFTALEELLQRRGTATAFAFGDQPTLADLCLVPQMFNARRFGLDTAPFPRLMELDTTARQHPAFEKAAPENQPDAE